MANADKQKEMFGAPCPRTTNHATMETEGLKVYVNNDGLGHLGKTQKGQWKRSWDQTRTGRRRYNHGINQPAPCKVFLSFSSCQSTQKVGSVSGHGAPHSGQRRTRNVYLVRSCQKKKAPHTERALDRWYT